MSNSLNFIINNKDAAATWGIYMAEGSLAALMAPPPNKQYIESECALEHGKRVITEGAKISDRDITLKLYLTASSIQQFFERYADFCAELAKGSVDIETAFQPGVVYHCNYISCSEFQQYDRRLGILSLRLNEPNPTRRT